MYTSTYSPSPTRATASDIEAANYRSSSSDPRQYYQPSTRHSTAGMTDSNAAFRYGTVGYSNSTTSLASIQPRTTTPSRKFPNEYSSSTNEPGRYQSTGYSSTSRAYADDDTYRSNTGRYDPGRNLRAHSYDDLLNEQNRTQSSMYNNPRGNQYNTSNAYRQPPPSTRRDQHHEYDDDLIVKSTDLSANNEQEMLDVVRTAFHTQDITNQRELAGFLKRAADKRFSSCWHCIVGRQFSSYVTHEMNGFIYFTKGPLSILLFKSGA